jgi:hypothetical protein
MPSMHGGQVGWLVTWVSMAEHGRRHPSRCSKTFALYCIGDFEGRPFVCNFRSGQPIPELSFMFHYAQLGGDTGFKSVQMLLCRMCPNWSTWGFWVSAPSQKWVDLRPPAKSPRLCFIPRAFAFRQVVYWHLWSRDPRQCLYEPCIQHPVKHPDRGFGYGGWWTRTLDLIWHGWLSCLDTVSSQHPDAIYSKAIEALCFIWYSSACRL